MKARRGVWVQGVSPVRWLGGYEYLRVKNKWTRYFALYRFPVRGAVRKRTKYFSSAFAAKLKGWKLV